MAVDISPVETTSVWDFRAYFAAMRAVDLPGQVPHSHARKLADEQLSSTVQVMSPTPGDQASVGGWGIGKSLGLTPPLDPGQDVAVRKFLLTNLVEADGRSVWRVNLDALDQHLDKIMAFPSQQDPYPGQTLFLIGGNSQFVL